MFFTNLKRIIRTGFVNFWRNSFVTLASILVMTTTLFVLGTFLFLDALLDQTLTNVSERVDINVYLEPGTDSSDAIALSDKLENLEEVSRVTYQSEEQVLADFEDRHINDEVINESLEELGDNPFGAVLNVQATDPSLYDSINNYLESDQVLTESGEDIVYDVNYNRNREAIERLTNIIQTIDFLSVAILIFFAVISVIITINTIRLAIYNSRDEISVMKLVGASDTYIRSPFVIEGIMYGIASCLAALLLLYPLALWVGDSAETFFGGVHLLDYYVDNFADFFLIIFVTGVVLGALSSFFAVKKYLKET